MHSIAYKPQWGQLPFPSFLHSRKDDYRVTYIKISPQKLPVIAMGMLKPRKFMQRRKKVKVFKDAADEADQKNWRSLVRQMDKMGSPVSVLKGELKRKCPIPRDIVLGTLGRYKQLKRWNLISEILEWLLTQDWWRFSKMDFLMLITAYGKQGNFNKAERALSMMKSKGHAPDVVSQTALMEAYGRAGRCNDAEAIFRRMQHSGPEPSALTYQIILKTFVEGNKFKEAEEIFETLLDEDKSPMKPDQRMFHMMIYMHKKSGSRDKARRIFALMSERGVEQSTATYNSLMSFETDYREVSKIYDQMQRANLRPDVVSYALLVSAYGKARLEDEALHVFEEMLNAGVRPTQKAYNILLDAFAISGMVEEASTVFKCMKRDRYTRDVCSYTTMLLAYVNASDMDGAEKFFRRLIQDGIQPNIVTYGTLIKGYAMINDLKKMMEKYEQMRKRGIKANQTILTTIMDAHGKNGDFGSAVAWYKEMESSGLPPDQKAKNILSSLAKTEEDKQEAQELTGYDDHDSQRAATVLGTSNEDNEDGDTFYSVEENEGEDEVNYRDDDWYQNINESVSCSEKTSDRVTVID